MNSSEHHEVVMDMFHDKPIAYELAMPNSRTMPITNRALGHECGYEGS